MDPEQRRRLDRWALQAAARELVPGERVAWCLRRPGFDQETRKSFREIKVMFAERVARAHYKNLMVCGSVWMCPLCASRITERRRVELAEGIESSGLVVALGTFTLQHSKGDDLGLMLAAGLEAFRCLKSGRRWIDFVERHGLVGSVRSLEVTYGVNGWHFHFHPLFFFKVGVQLARAEEDLKEMWPGALGKHGRFASWERGVDLRSAESDVVDYVAKTGHEPVDLGRPSRWGLDAELIKSQVKQSRSAAGRTPTQLLADYLNDQDQVAGRLWQEYAKCFKGRHQLVWSRGLRRVLGLGREESDLEIAERQDEESILLASLSLHDWWVVLANDARGELLEVASSGDLERLGDFLRLIGAWGCERVTQEKEGGIGYPRVVTQDINVLV